MKELKPWHIGAAVVAIAVLLVAHAAWMSSTVNVAQANQVHDDMKPVHQEAQQQQQQAVRAEDLNQKALLAFMATVATQKQQPVTAVDYSRIEQMIESRLGVKAEIKADPDRPDSPSATLPARQLRDFMLDADACKAGLVSCQRSVVNESLKFDAEKKDHEATKAELAAARKAMKGGGFWHNVKVRGKYLAIGAAAGAVAGTVLKH